MIGFISNTMLKTRFARCLLAIVLINTSPINALSTQYFCRSDGSDANTGLANTAGGAWRNVSKAASTLVAGDRCDFAAGTYSGNITFNANGSSGSKITFSGGTWTGTYTINGDYVVLTNQLFTAYGNPVINIASGSDGAEVRAATYNTGLAHRFVLIDGNSATVDSCNITDLALATMSPGGGTFFATSGNNITISNNNLHDNDNTEAFGYVWGRNITISGNLMTNCNNSRYDLVHADFLQCFAYAANVVSSNVVVTGNRIINSDSQMFMLNGANTGVPQSPNMGWWYIHNNIFQNSWQSGSCYLQNTEIANNTFYHWGYNNGYCFVVRDGAGSGSYSSGTNVTVYGNTVVEWNTGGNERLLSNEVPGTVVRNNHSAGFNGTSWFNHTWSFAEPGTIVSGNITGNPVFVQIGATNASNNDFALQTTSPLKNAALTLTSFATDILGLSRPQGPAWDIGAYEFPYNQIATQLGFSGQPTPVTAGSTISPAVTVTAYDSAGVRVGGYTGTITVAIGSNPGGGTLSGTLSAAAFAGIATFNNLSINNAGNGYTLVATAAGLTGATSAAFNVNPVTPVTPGVPVLTSPSNGATGQSVSPTLVWGASANSTGYDVQVATDAGFASIVSAQTNITATSFVPVPALSPAITYYWRVRGRNSGGVSAFATAFSFSTSLPAPGIPVLSSPADGATGVVLNPTLSWSAVTYAATYRVQVATDSGFSSLVFDQTQTATSAAPSLSAGTLYYWHVRAQNATGNSAYAVTRSFTTSPPPAPSAPVLSSPSDGATSQSITPTLTWNSSATATSYRIQVAIDAGFTSIIADVSGLTSNSYIPTLLNSTLYYWHVNASNTGGSSAYSTARNFTTIAAIPPAPGSPTLASPADAATGLALNPTLSWNSSSGATSYRIQVSTDAGFVTVISDQAGLTSTSFAPSLVASTQYWWHVNASNAGGTSSYSTARTFTTGAGPTPPPPPLPPTLVSPANTATGQLTSPVLTWATAGTNVTSYRLQVSTSSSFGSTVVDVNGVVSTNYTPVLSTGTTYYWHVLSNNAVTNGGYSETFSFTTVPAVPAAPVLSSPANAATGQSITPSLVWLTSPGATSYGLQVATDAGFSSLVVNLTGLSGLSYVPNLTTGTTYYWHVNANNSGGTSSYSSTRTFTTVPTVPAVPTLSSPANGATGVSTVPSLVWIASPGATSYHLQVSTDAGFGALVVDISGITITSYVPSLSSATLYYWRVLATNSGGSSAYTTARTFTTVPVTPAVPALLFPANGAVNQSLNPGLTWNISPGATSYRLQVSISPVFASVVVDVNGIGGTTYYPSLTASTTYYWRVSASNSGGTSSFSTGLSFSTGASPPPQPVVNSRARLLMLIDRNGRWFKFNTSITNNADQLLARFSFYVPGDWLTNQLAGIPAASIP